MASPSVPNEGRGSSPSGELVEFDITEAPRAAASVVDSHQTASPASSPDLPAVCDAPRRSCTVPGCRRIIGSAAHDPHNVCISCRHGICSVDSRCAECVGWSSEVVESASRHQSRLQRKRESCSRKRGRSTPSVTHTTTEASQESVLCVDEMGESLCGSVNPHDSISQAAGSAHGPSPPFSAFLEQFSTFFGFDSGPPRTSFKDMVSELVTEQVQRQLECNVPSLPACSVPSAQGVAEAITNSPSHRGAKLSAEALRADVSGGSSRGQEPSASRVKLR